MQIPLGKEVEHPENVPELEELKCMNVTQNEIYNNLQPSQKFFQDLFF